MHDTRGGDVTHLREHHGLHRLVVVAHRLVALGLRPVSAPNSAEGRDDGPYG